MKVYFSQRHQPGAGTTSKDTGSIAESGGVPRLSRELAWAQASANERDSRKSLEVGIAGHDLRSVPLGRRQDDRVGHGKAVLQGDVRGLERETLVQRNDRRGPKSGDGLG